MTDQLPEVEPCPHCREPIVEGEESWYFRGAGPPPSYAVRCDSCGAQGPYGNGKFRGDHAGAQAAAISLWNERASTPADDALEAAKAERDRWWNAAQDRALEVQRLTANLGQVSSAYIVLQLALLQIRMHRLRGRKTQAALLAEDALAKTVDLAKRIGADETTGDGLK